MSVTFSERCCATCRHWKREDGYFDTNGKWIEHEHHRCTRLVVVTAHTYGTPYEKGDVVTRDEAWGRDLAIESLRTDWNHGCRAWNREEPVPARWAPIEDGRHIGFCRCPWCVMRLWRRTA